MNILCNFIYFSLTSSCGSPKYFTCYFSFRYLPALVVRRGHAVMQLVEALRYQPVGRGFDYRWYLWNCSLT